MSVSIMKIGSVQSTAFSSGSGDYYPVPEFSCEYPEPGEKLTVNYSPSGEADFIWYIDDEPISCEGDTYIPTEDDLEKFIKVEVYDDEKLVSTLSVFFSLLPVIYIDTENGAEVESKDEYINSNIKIQGNKTYNSKTTTLYSGKSEIKGRGNSTWNWFDKKPYKLKLDKKTDLFGMGKNKHWVLLANYIDDSLMRNAASVELAKILGAEYLDCVWVDVVFNGECIGNYQLYEHARIDENRVDIFDWEGVTEDIAKAIKKKDGLSDDDADAVETQLTENTQWITSGEFSYNGKTYIISDYYTLPDFSGGLFFEADTSFDELSKFYSDGGVPVMINSPEFLFTNEEAMSVAKNIVQKMENSFISANRMIKENDEYISYTDLCDFDSLVSYFLTSEMLQNEAGYKSTYFYKDIDGKINFGPIWDFDFSANNVAPFGTTYAKRWKMLDSLWFGGLAKDPYFAVKVRELFIQNYKELVNFYTEGGIIDTWSEYLYASGIKNQTIWPYSRGFEEDTEVLRTWFKEKIDWISKEFADDNAALISLGGSVSDKLSVSLSATQTNEGYIINQSEDKITLKVSAQEGYNEAIYCINGKYAGTLSLENGSAKTDIEASALTEESGEKNVITVYLVAEDGTMTQYQYVTVTVNEEAPKLVKVTFLEPAIRTVNVVDGSYIYLTEPEEAEENTIFAGWNDGLDTTKADSYYHVSGNVTLSPLFVKCANGTTKHTLITQQGRVICSVCGEEKGADESLIHVSAFTFDYTRSKYNNPYSGSEVYPKMNVMLGEKVLTEGVDYKISYKNNINVGYATFTVTGIEEAGFTGEVSLSYRIVPVDVSTLKIKISDAEYNGKPQTPSVNITHNGRTLEEGSDYTVTYLNNTEVGQATAVITGKGNYTGSSEVNFSVLYPLDIVGGLSAENTCVGSIRVSWTSVKDCDGYNIYRKTSGEASYVKIATVFGKNTSVFHDTTAVEGKKYYYKVSAIKLYNGETYEKLSDTYVAKTASFGHKYVTVKTPATAKADGSIVSKCSICGCVKSETVIRKIGTVSLSFTTASYTGKAIKPKVTVKDSKGNVISSVNYSVTYSSNKKVGTAKVKITFKNNYSGSAEKSFTITPAQVKTLKASAVTKSSIKLSWSKASGAVYYRVQQSTDGKKWTTVATVKTNTLKVSKLSAGRNYQFRVIALDSSKKIKSNASPVLKTGTLTNAPEVTLTSKSLGSVKVSWKKVSGAEKYIIYKSVDSKNWIRVASTNKLTYNLTKLPTGKKLYI
ncbi:MAG: CotH kinase family protein, partial [Acutalibacteraceae bacterium]